MKTRFLNALAAVILLLMPTINFGQVINLGSAADFVLFSTDGAVSNTGITHLTGNVGTNNGSSTAFGNVDGVMHDQDSTSAQTAADLLTAYNQLNSTVATFFPAPLLGNGASLIAGVYYISSAATLNLDLTLDAKGNSSAVFIFKIWGSFSANASSKIKLINGAQACNVYWIVEGLVSMASGTSMKGTIIANNAAIIMNTGDTLEGRALSTAGAITVDGVLAYTPIGCGSVSLTGPASPDLGTAECYAIFSSSGGVTNAGVTIIKGDVGTNVGLTTGFDSLNVTGKIHPIPDLSTAACAVDLLKVYHYLDSLPNDIELLYPAQFGNNLVLTPHTYIMNAATVFTDTLFLNAQGDANAVFVIKIKGALSTSTYAKVLLINGAQAKNVYWNIDGEVNINEYSIFRGTIVCNNGAINIKSHVTLDGRALTTTGALSTMNITATMPPGCGTTTAPNITTQPINQTVCAGTSASFSVIATGTSLTFQWRKGTVNLTNGGNISGAMSNKLKINPVSISDAASNYNVVITGTLLPNVTSNNVSLSVNATPNIISQPTNQTTTVGGSASFSVIATGTGITYQWRRGAINLSNSANISGVASAALTINPVNYTDTASNYNVIIIGICSPIKTSKNVSLSIGTSQAPTVLSTDPANLATLVALTKKVTAIFSEPMNTSTLTTPTTFTIKQTLTSTPVPGTVTCVNATAVFTPTGNLLAGTTYTATITTAAKNIAGIPMVSDYVWTFSTGSLVTSAVISTNPKNLDTGVVLNKIITANFNVPMNSSTINATTFTLKKGVTPVAGAVSYSGTTASFTPTSALTSNTIYTCTITTGAKDVTGTPLANNYQWSFTTGTTTGIASFEVTNSTKVVTIYPNPFTSSIDIILNDALKNNMPQAYELRIYNIWGEVVKLTAITKQVTTLETSNLPSGNYFYKIIGNNKTIQSGKLVSQQ